MEGKCSLILLMGVLGARALLRKGCQNVGEDQLGRLRDYLNGYKGASGDRCPCNSPFIKFHPLIAPIRN